MNHTVGAPSTAGVLGEGGVEVRLCVCQCLCLRGQIRNRYLGEDEEDVDEDGDEDEQREEPEGERVSVPGGAAHKSAPRGKCRPTPNRSALGQ